MEHINADFIQWLFLVRFYFTHNVHTFTFLLFIFLQSKYFTLWVLLRCRTRGEQNDPNCKSHLIESRTHNIDCYSADDPEFNSVMAALQCKAEQHSVLWDSQYWVFLYILNTTECFIEPRYLATLIRLPAGMAGHSEGVLALEGDAEKGLGYGATNFSQPTAPPLQMSHCHELTDGLRLNALSKQKQMTKSSCWSAWVLSSPAYCITSGSVRPHVDRVP